MENDNVSKNPINLTLRFLLELAALYAMGYWAWTQNDRLLRIVLTIGLPLFAATMWGVFRVPGDPKDAPVAIEGWLRLILEAVFFGGAIALLVLAGRSTAALIFAVLVIGHYITSYDRIQWLLSQ
jgi:hypothetical protein